MDWLLYLLASGTVRLIEALPLRAVARLARLGGAIAWGLDVRHRRVAIENLTRCFGTEWTPQEIRRLARENFRRIGENFACAVKTASMTPAQVREILEVTGTEKLPRIEGGQRCVCAIGHFGNFELYASAGMYAPGYQFATTYRALRQPALNRLMQSMREKSGCLYFERRTDGGALKEAMNRGGLMLGFLSDQSAGRKGVWGPLFGQECSTTPAPAVFALRYRCALHPAFCFRTALGRWRIEVGEAIPTHDGGQARAVEEITRDINRAFEAAIRCDPANWFWVHRRWKARGRDGGAALPTAASEDP